MIVDLTPIQTIIKQMHDDTIDSVLRVVDAYRKAQ